MVPADVVDNPGDARRVGCSGLRPPLLTPGYGQVAEFYQGLTELVRRAVSRWHVEHGYRKLTTALGLGYFEGRSWIGRHRHVTLTAAAHLFLTHLRTTPPRSSRADAPRRRVLFDDHARRYRTVHVQAGDHTIAAEPYRTAFALFTMRHTERNTGRPTMRSRRR